MANAIPSTLYLAPYLDIYPTIARVNAILADAYTSSTLWPPTSELAGYRATKVLQLLAEAGWDGRWVMHNTEPRMLTKRIRALLKLCMEYGSGDPEEVKMMDPTNSKRPWDKSMYLFRVHIKREV